MAEIYNDNDYTLVSGTSGSDSVYNDVGDNVTINTGAGNDFVYTDFGNHVTINTGAGADFVQNTSGNNVTIDTGAGNDFVYNKLGYNVTINTGAGNDSVYNNIGANVTINTGAGRDLISLDSNSYNNVIIYNDGDGNDIIYGFDDTSTLSIGGGEYSTTQSGKNIIVTVGDGKITLVGAASLDELQIKGKENKSEKNSWSLSGTTAKYGTSSNTLFTINGVKSVNGLSLIGNTVTVSKAALGTSKVTISDGYTLKLGSDVTKPSTNKAAWSLSGTTATYKQTKSAGYTLADNVITYSKASSETAAIIKGVKSMSGFSVSGNVIKLKNSSLNSKVTVSGGYEFDFASDYSKATITGSSSADTIIARGKNILVNGDKGDDTIKIIGSGTVTGGAGSDVFYYKSTGKNVITDYAENDKISLESSTAKVTTSGSDVVFTVDKGGKITVKGGAGKSITYIDTKGREKIYTAQTETNSWKLSGAKATYGTSSKTLVTVSGVTSTDGLDIDGKVVTVSKSSLGTKNVTISGSYTLALGDDVSEPSTKKASWDLDKPTATYKGSYKTAGYKLSSNSKKITYSKATTAKELATITGAKSTSGLTPNGKVIKLKNSNLNKQVTVSGGYEFDFQSDYKTATITGSSKADTITARGSKISVDGGKGNDLIKIIGTGTVKGGDGKDTFFYNSSKANIIIDYDAEDIISIKSGTADVTTEGDDVIFNGKITVKGGANQTITYYDGGGKQTYIAEENPDTEAEIILPKTYTKANYTLKDDIYTLDASNVQRELKIKGNDLSNKIIGSSNNDNTIDGGISADSIYGGNGNDSLFGGKGNDVLDGGKGNDVLKGGDGSDVFIYKDGYGKDTIEDYAAGDDTIKFDSVKISDSDITSSNGNIIFKIGSGSLTVKNVENQEITYIDASNKEKPYNNNTPIVWNGNHKSVTLKSSYSSSDFNQKNYSQYVDKLETIDASAVNHDINIVGNEKANSIIGGSQNDLIDGDAASDTLHGGDGSDTLIGGAGNDVLYGDNGADIFFFSNNDGDDIIADFKEEDKIQVVANKSDVKGVSTNKDGDVIFNLGNLKITLKDGADKYIPLYDNFGKILVEHEQEKLYQLITDEDEFLSDETQLSSIVKNNSVDYLIDSTDTTLNLNTDRNFVPVIAKTNQK